MNGVKQKWLSGSIVNEYEVVMPLISSTGSAHSLLQARFYIRHYENSTYTKTDVIVENTKNFAQDIDNIPYDATIYDSSNTLMFSETGVVHNIYARWKETIWDGGRIPGTDARLDTTYFLSTKALPNYDRSIPMNPGSIYSSLGMNSILTGSKSKVMGL